MSFQLGDNWHMRSDGNWWSLEKGLWYGPFSPAEIRARGWSNVWYDWLDQRKEISVR